MTGPAAASSGARRRILLVAPNISRRMGGEGLKALQIHLELRALGHEVRQVAHARVRDEMARDYPELAIDYVEDTPLQVRLFRMKAGPLLALLNAWQLHRLAQAVAARFRPDLVHFTSPISPVLPYFRFPGFPVVIGPLNGNVSYPPAFAARDPRASGAKQAVIAALQWTLGRVFRGKHRATLLVAGGDRTARSLRLAGCSPRRFVPTLDSGIPDALVDRARFRQQGENFRFVHVGRLVGYKGCDLAIRAVAASDPRVTLDIIGDGEERGALERLAADLGVAARVTFHGWMTPGPAMYDRLGAYRGLLQPALAEANGIAYQEAMTLGLPILCLDWAGPRELLSKGEAVLVAPDGGEPAVVAALAEGMTHLATDPEAADRMSARARAKAEALGFRWRDLLSRWQDSYALAIAGRSA